mmetsp:Transcript_26595/g.63238  ORF Transcript_26595/g.63238 Transcript_26595/m.63238 type:complete len:88 (-) Transcript_26595:1679-1942(-)
MAISTIGVANGAEFDGGAVWTDIDSSSDRRTAAMALSPKLASTEHLEGDTQVIRRLTLLATELVQNTLYPSCRRCERTKTGCCCLFF